MKSPRLLYAGTSVEIARILMQKRRQNGVGDQASGKGIGKASSQALAISFCTLPPFIRVVTRLLNPSPPRCAGEEDWTGEAFVGQVKLHLRGKWLGVGFIHHIDIRYETQNALLFFSFELLG